MKSMVSMRSMLRSALVVGLTAAIAIAVGIMLLSGPSEQGTVRVELSDAAAN
jgi:hypothetical protein